MAQEDQALASKVAAMERRIKALEKLQMLGLTGADMETLQLEVRRQASLLGRIGGEAGIGNLLYGMEIPATVKVLDYDLTEVNVDNTAVETDVYSFLIPAGTLAALGGVRLRIGGDLKSDATGTLTIKIKWGTENLTSAATTIQSAAARWPYTLDMVVAASAVTAQKVSVWFQATVSSAPFGLRRADISGSHLGNGRGAFTQDLLKGVQFDITVKWSVAGANLLFRRDIAVLELLSQRV